MLRSQARQRRAPDEMKASTPDSDPILLLLFQHSSRRVHRKPLRGFLADAARAIAPQRALTCLVTTDSELRRLNREFLRKDYATDVLSFPSANENELGEIAISFDRALDQAAEMGHGVEEELRILILHGILHLRGMDHETDSGQMARAERIWRKRFGLPRGLIERSKAKW